MSTIDPATPAPAISGKALPVGEGVTWIGRGWELFLKAPLMWVIIVLILGVLSLVLNMAGFIGNLIYSLTSPVFAAGIAKGCQSLEQGGDLEFEHLFAGFTGERLVPLLILGAIVFAAYASLFLVFMLFAGISVLSGIAVGDPTAILAMSSAVGLPILLGLLVVLALAIPVMAANWFAPTLIMLNGLSPLEAAKASFWGCMRNFWGFAVYGIVMLLLAIVAVIPVFLGLLVWVPLSMASTYAAYRQIYTAD